MLNIRGIFGSMVTIIAVFCLGCGTVTTGGKQEIRLASVPEGATVVSTKAGIGAKMTYTTPATVSFERKGHYVISFDKEGYESQQIELQKSMRGWMLVWDIVLFPVGVVVDAITGAWYRLEPDQVSVTLTKQSSSIDGPEQIQILISNRTPVRGWLRLMSAVPVSVTIKRVE